MGMSGDQRIRTVRLFVSSPSDVQIERERIGIVVARLNEVFSDLVRIEALRWESRFYPSHGGFQDQIPPAAGSDLVVAIFWSRLGTPLPETFARMDTGERYPSGTAFEVLTAIEARKKGDRPDVYVFRKVAPPAQAGAEATAQWKDLNGFFHRWFQAPDGQFLRAFHQFEDADEFEHQVERLLRDWIAERVPRDRSLIWPIETKGSPFRALLPFDAKHAAIYFGRDRKVTRAIEQLQSVARAQRGARPAPVNVPFLLIVGESGAGKSSLMRAGLAPRLTAPGVVPAVALWRTAIVRIGDDPDPFLSLAKALHVENDEKGGFGSALPELKEAGYPTADALREVLAKGGEIGARKRAPAAAPVLKVLARLQAAEMERRKSRRRLRVNLLLMVDQLENIFAQTVTDAQRSAFARLLFALCATRRVWIVATVRSDISPRLITPGDFLALKDAGGVYDLAAPGEPELTEIVHKSAAASGLTYEKDEETGVCLDEQILADAKGKNTLPLLQFALERLFQERKEVDGETRLTFAAYNAMQRLDGAINQTAEGALAGLGKVEIDALPRLLRFLAAPVHDRGSATAGVNELTVSLVPKAVAVRDDASERLVRALVDARIVVSDISAGGPAGESRSMIGISHQRVFESWERARAIIAEHREFFRIREEVETQHRRWIERKRPADLLLQKGVSLAEGQKIVKDYGDELDPDVRGYVAASNRRAQRFNIFMGAAAAIFAVLFVASAVLGLLTKQAQEVASKNYGAAKGAVSDLVSLITQGLQDVAGIQLSSVQKVLGLVDETLEKVQRVSHDDPELARVRAAMHFQSAKIYQKKEAHARAVEAALESLRIRDGLTGFAGRAAAPAAFAATPAPWRWELSQSLELIGDLYRQERRTGEARAYFQDTLTIRLELADRAPDDETLLLGISQVYTRIGDIDVNSDLAAALRSYQSSLAIAAKTFNRAARNEQWQRELSWAYNKVGDVKARQGEADAKAGNGAGARTSYAAALEAFDNSLCLRRRTADGHPENTEWQRDVPYSLNRIGTAKVRLDDFPGAELAYFEALEIRRRLGGSVRDNALFLGDIADSSRLIGDYYFAASDLKWALAFYEAAADYRTQVAVSSPIDGRAQRNAEEARNKVRTVRLAMAEQYPDEGGSEEWWRRSVRDAQARYARLKRGIAADPDACWDGVTASVDRIIGPGATGTVR
jgi:tetratricopeptide (TPR) repeat protein